MALWECIDCSYCFEYMIFDKIYRVLSVMEGEKVLPLSFRDESGIKLVETAIGSVSSSS